MASPAPKKYKLQSVKYEKQAINVFSNLAIEFCRLKGDGPAKSNVQSRIIALMRQEHKNVKILWESFTTDRERLSVYLRDPAKSTAAYILGFHLPNMIRTLKTWERLERRGDLAAMLSTPDFKGNIQIVDLGCGTGAISQATAISLINLGIPAQRIKTVGFDRNGRFLDAYRYGFKDILPAENVAASKLDIVMFAPTRLDLSEDDMIIMTLGYTWNEIASKPALAQKILSLIERVLSSPRGMLFVLEPANQNPSRETMQLREFTSEFSQILYPCQGSFSCPMLEKKKDWCFSEFEWEPPKTLTFLDKRLGIDRRRLKSTVLVTVSQKLGQRFGQPDSNKATLVGKPFDKFGKPELLLCSDSGLSKSQPKGRTHLKKGESLPMPSTP